MYYDPTLLLAGFFMAGISSYAVGFIMGVHHDD